MSERFILMSEVLDRVVATEVARQLSTLIKERPIVSPEWVSPHGAAKIIGMSVGGLEMRRHRGIGPPYSKHGPRIVRYRVKDLHSWMEAGYVAS
jgi:hypothetical protein